MTTFLQHTADRCPIPLNAPVVYVLADDEERFEACAGSLNWGHAPDDEGRVCRYLPLIPSAAGFAPASFQTQRQSNPDWEHLPVEITMADGTALRGLAGSFWWGDAAIVSWRLLVPLECERVGATRKRRARR